MNPKRVLIAKLRLLRLFHAALKSTNAESDDPNEIEATRILMAENIRERALLLTKIKDTPDTNEPTISPSGDATANAGM